MWRVRKSDTSADSGFSLLEVIIAMGILSAGLLAIETA
jgi:prepilin-type N-terminal cleavage/methylation domain-containing protein